MRNSKRKNNKTNNTNKRGNKKKPVFFPGEANEEVFKGQVAIFFPTMWIGKGMMPSGVQVSKAWRKKSKSYLEFKPPMSKSELYFKQVIKTI